MAAEREVPKATSREWIGLAGLARRARSSEQVFAAAAATWGVVDTRSTHEEESCDD